jgi:hypothetical protein
MRNVQYGDVYEISKGSKVSQWGLGPMLDKMYHPTRKTRENNDCVQTALKVFTNSETVGITGN